MSVWKFNITTDWDTIYSEAFQTEWENILHLSPNAHVFFTPVLVKVWIETYRPLRDLTPYFILAENDKGVKAFMPFVLWKRNWKNAFMHTLIPVGYSDYDYHDPIFTQDVTTDEIKSFWTALFEALKKSCTFDEFIIDGLHDKYAAPLMAQSSTDFKMSNKEICPYLTLTDIQNEEQLYSALPTKLRGDIRRQIRRLNEQGDLSFKTYSTYDEALTTFNDFIEAHRNRWPNAYKAPHFHENLIKMGVPSSLVHFSSLNIDGNPIAWHLGFQYNNRYYYYMPAGNMEYAKFSPVKVHLFHLMSKAVEVNMSVFDHLRGDENYKGGWSNGFEEVSSVIYQNNSLSSKVKHAIYKLRSIL